MKQKGFPLILVLLVMALIAVALGYTAQTPMGLPTQPAIEDAAGYKVLFGYEEKLNETGYTNGIYLLDPEDPPPEKILDNPDYQTENNSQFSKLQFTNDGKYLGWFRTGRKEGSVFEYGIVDESSIKNIRSVGGWSRYIESFAWAPDAQRFAILERIGDGAERSYRVKIFDTETATQVSEFPVIQAARQYPANFLWPKNNKLMTVLVVFATEHTPREEYKVLSYYPDGSKEFERTIHSVSSSSFRPDFDISQDGEYITFVKKFRIGEGNNFGGELWYGRIDSSEIRKIADAATERCSNSSPVSISPDGSLVAVGSHCSYGVKAQIINTVDGAVGTAEATTTSAIWSPDGGRIWTTERLYDSEGSPLSRSNYILDSRGRVIKKLAFYSPYVVWLPNE